MDIGATRRTDFQTLEINLGNLNSDIVELNQRSSGIYREIFSLYFVPSSFLEYNCHFKKESIQRSCQEIKAQLQNGHSASSLKSGPRNIGIMPFSNNSKVMELLIEYVKLTNQIASLQKEKTYCRELKYSV